MKIRFHSVVNEGMIRERAVSRQNTRYIDQWVVGQIGDFWRFQDERSSSPGFEGNAVIQFIICLY